MNKTQKHEELCKILNDTFKRKNADYGDSFGEMFQELGIITAVTRIGDKFNRLKSLVKKPKKEQMVKDESIRDTLLDMANYCIMTVIEMDNTNNFEQTVTMSSASAYQKYLETNY